MTEHPKRVRLYERLPEIYRIRDADQLPPGQLAAFLGAAEEVLGALHENIEALYNDFFIETCDDWVIPYIADLLGTSHLKGSARTLRADVADTIALRRRKGTLGAIERLAANLTRWPCRAVELRANLGWTQHLNHQRPDAGGAPPYGAPRMTRFAVRRGGTAPIRDPAMLSLAGTPFDPFAYTADVKRADDGARHINLPNLAIFLWRLVPYRLGVTRPIARGAVNLGAPPAGSERARFAVRFDIDPLDRPVRLFNTYRQPQASAAGNVQTLTEADAVPGPMLRARIDSGSEAGNPVAYVSVDAFDDTATPPGGLDLGDTGLQVYIPASILDGVEWRFRGANLCAWETGLKRPLRRHEIVIDPEIGRIVIGVASAAERNVLITSGGGPAQPKILLGYTYGAVGPVGAHPISRNAEDGGFPEAGAELRVVNALEGGPTLQDQLADLHDETGPVIVEIRDSMVHDLDPSTLSGALTEGGITAIRLARPLMIRAASGARPVIRLAAPLAFRPTDPAAETVTALSVHISGVFVTRAAGFAPAGGPLVARAALARLELRESTLDPGGHRLRDGSRADLHPAMALANGYGFADAGEEDAFEPTPDIVISRSVTGALLVDDGYALRIQDSIVDAGQAVGEDPGTAMAVAAASSPVTGHGAPLSVRGATFLGRVRVREARGSGGLFIHRLEVWNHQKGCLKHSYFSGDGDRPPPHHACVTASDAKLVVTSTWHGEPGYCQLARGTDFRIQNRGPGDDAMGAFGFLLEAHKWINLNVRLRESMPVGVRALVLPVT